MDDQVRQLALLTGGKAVVNTSHRWIPFFLPTLAGALTTGTSTLTIVLGVGEMAGLSTLVVGRQLDLGRERVIMTGALLAVGSASALALVGSLPVFVCAYVVMLIGVGLYTTSGHAYLSRRVAYGRRARSIGVFETSWAFALLVGAPVVAVTIELFGWRGPFALLAIVAVVMAAVVGLSPDRTRLLDDNGPAATLRITGEAWRLIAASAAIATSGLTTVVIIGTWLDEALGVSTGGVGLVAMGFGLAELTASGGSAAIADRLGPVTATTIALVGVLVGLGIMAIAGSSLAVGVIGLVVFFCGFEFSIVTSFTIVSESLPTARGRTLAVNNGVGTLCRGTGIAVSGSLYAAFGIRGPVTVSAVGVVLALGLLAGRRDSTRPASRIGSP